MLLVLFKLAMSASSPIWRGYLAEIDCRWNVLCAMSDDRTSEERGFEVNRSLF
jgi:glutamate--cysteine ligase catalytic subunit